MIKFFLCVALGVVGHQTSPIFDSIEKGMNGHGTAWPRIGRYAVGGVMINMATLIMLRGSRYSFDDRTNTEMVGGAMSNGMVAVGAGVALGYVLDRYK